MWAISSSEERIETKPQTLRLVDLHEQLCCRRQIGALRLDHRALVPLPSILGGDDLHQLSVLVRPQVGLEFRPDDRGGLLQPAKTNKQIAAQFPEIVRADCYRMPVRRSRKAALDPSKRRLQIALGLMHPCNGKTLLRTQFFV